MGGAYSIIAINVALGLVLLAAITAVWLYDRSRPAALFLLLCIVGFLAAGVLELAAPAIASGDAPLVRLAQHSTNLVASILLVMGIRSHYGLSTHGRWMALYALLGILAAVLVIDMPRDSPWRMAVNQAPMVLVIAWGALRLALTTPPSPASGHAPHGPLWLRWLVVVACGVFALNLASRPLILSLTGTMGDGPGAYHGTLYALISQFQHAIVTMATGVIVLIALVSDLFADLRFRSGLDPLTGLFNRTGFEPAATGTLERAAAERVPVTLILVEADALGTIVDRFGPQVGDEVVRALAALLRAEMKPLDVPARLDGARFAMVLWNTDDRLACQAAQARLRIFPVLAADILPDGEVLTASFGVAERMRGETAHELLDLAGTALRKARRFGGDRVVSTRDLDENVPGEAERSASGEAEANASAA